MTEEFIQKLNNLTQKSKPYFPMLYTQGEILRSKESQEDFVLLDYEQTSEEVNDKTIIFFLGKVKEIEKYKKVYFDGLEKLPEIQSISVSLYNIKEKYELLNKRYGAISFGLWPVKWKK